MHSVEVIDSHTGGEPTRLVLQGGPDLGTGPLAERLERFRARYDGFRSSVICEPRGSDVLVGALLTPPVRQDASVGVIFFNNVGYLGMCGHGTIGAIASLAYLGQLAPGRHLVETPVGTVGTTLHGDGRVEIANVASYRHLRDVPVRFLDATHVERVVHGDVAWGGNWFFLCDDHGADVVAHDVSALTKLASTIRRALADQGITGADGAKIDHVELLVPSDEADARSFVLCPGDAYDRSPCGTGTSAKLACLAADSRLEPDATWRQESVIGSRFVASYRWDDEERGRVIPTIAGRAWVTARATLLFDERDPFRDGIRLDDVDATGSARASASAGHPLHGASEGTRDC